MSIDPRSKTPGSRGNPGGSGERSQKPSGTAGGSLGGFAPCVSAASGGGKNVTIFPGGAPQGGLSCPFGAIHLLYGGKNSSHGAKCRGPGSAGARHPSGVPSPSPRRSRGGAVSGKGRSRFPESSQSASVKPVRPNGADRFHMRSDCSFIRFGGFAAKARKFLV